MVEIFRNFFQAIRNVTAACNELAANIRHEAVEITEALGRDEATKLLTDTSESSGNGTAKKKHATART